jgi:hypothetical protein
MIVGSTEPHVPAPTTLAPVIPALSPGTAAQVADPLPEATPNPPPAVTVAATEPGRKSVLSLAPTAGREDQRSRHHRRHMSAPHRQAASSSLDRTTLSPTHWPHRRTATTSSAHSWGQPQPCSSRNYQSPLPRCLSTAIPLPGDLGRTFHLH